MSPALAGGFFTTSATWEARVNFSKVKVNFKLTESSLLRFYHIVLQKQTLDETQENLQDISKGKIVPLLFRKIKTKAG